MNPPDTGKENPTLGNFILTRDNNIAVIDRNFFLEFSEQDRSALKGSFLTKSLSPLLKHILSLPENQQLNQQEREKITARATQATTRISSDGLSPELVQEVLLDLRKQGVKIPLRFSLLTLNLFVLSRFEESLG